MSEITPQGCDALTECQLLNLWLRTTEDDGDITYYIAEENHEIEAEELSQVTCDTLSISQILNLVNTLAEDGGYAMRTVTIV